MCIGFAETATGIGMAIADQLMLPYISTTREIIHRSISHLQKIILMQKIISYMM